MSARAIGMRALAATALLLSASARSDAEPAALTAHVTGLHSDRGQIGCMLFASADGFPREPKKAVERTFAPILGGTGTCRFLARPGSYAIIAMHDENGNGTMDRNFLGIPKEGFGASRGAHGAFGPKFADARFDYIGGAQSITITIRY
jgi:uncharacterized protein (DUF2141 family)